MGQGFFLALPHSDTRLVSLRSVISSHTLCTYGADTGFHCHRLQGFHVLPSESPCPSLSLNPVSRRASCQVDTCPCQLPRLFSTCLISGKTELSPLLTHLFGIRKGSNIFSVHKAKWASCFLPAHPPGLKVRRSTNLFPR